MLFISMSIIFLEEYCDIGFKMIQALWFCFLMQLPTNEQWNNNNNKTIILSYLILFQAAIQGKSLTLIIDI